LRDSDGSANALCGIATDITDRQAATNALRDLAVNLEHRVARRTGELAQVNRELEAFAYSVSHDLRAPLTSINGFAELLMREQGPKLDATANRYLTRIRDGSVRMAGLIQDLLGLSRVTQQGIENRPIDLLSPIETAVKALREAEPTRSVMFTAPATLAAHGDLKLLSLALANLLSNSWKYTSKTANACVEVGLREQAGEKVYFVKDNGAGFNPDYADRLFRPFVRLHSESEFPGTGIGLATVARIINRHGGRIWAESKPGEGATFFFTLPIPEEESATTHKSET
jgi:light-regulated signal transduction histidine kinase (bacteriophytochrome)